MGSGPHPGGELCGPPRVARIKTSNKRAGTACDPGLAFFVNEWMGLWLFLLSPVGIRLQNVWPIKGYPVPVTPGMGTCEFSILTGDCWDLWYRQPLPGCHVSQSRELNLYAVYPFAHVYAHSFGPIPLEHLPNIDTGCFVLQKPYCYHFMMPLDSSHYIL